MSNEKQIKALLKEVDDVQAENKLLVGRVMELSDATNRLEDALRESALLRKAAGTVISVAEQRADFRCTDPDWNPDAHVELTLTIADLRSLDAALASGQRKTRLWNAAPALLAAAKQALSQHEGWHAAARCSGVGSTVVADLRAAITEAESEN